MSWFGNTLFPVMQDVFADDESLPVKPEEAAEAIGYGSDGVAKYVEKLTEKGLRKLYEQAGLVEPSIDRCSVGRLLLSRAAARRKRVLH